MGVIQWVVRFPKTHYSMDSPVAPLNTETPPFGEKIIAYLGNFTSTSLVNENKKSLGCFQVAQT